MTVNTTASEIEYTGNGVSTVFPVPFLFPENGDLVVIRVDAAGNSTTLVLGTDYTVSGAGNAAGGSVTLTAPLAVDVLLNISRNLDVVQETDLRNQGKFYQQTIEDSFDYLTMLIQQAFSWLGRALVRPVGKSYYDAEGRQIANVGDPLVGGDAVNRNWVSTFVGNLLSQIQGPINNAANIFYQAPDSSPHVVQDMSGSAGASLIGYSGGTVADALDSLPVERRSLDYHISRMASGLSVKIACYGDSTTDGNATTSWVANPVDGSGNAIGNSDHNLTAPFAWPAVLQGVLRDMYGNNNIAVWNAGYSGQRMDNGWALANYDRAVTNNPYYGHPDVAFIDFGLNDIVDGLGVLENHLQQTELLVRKLLKQGTLPVLFSSGPEFRDTADGGDQRDNEQISQQINVAKRTICEQFSIPFIDKALAMKSWLESMNGSDGTSWATLQADALHFGDLGHRFQATYLAMTLYPDAVIMNPGEVQNISFMDSRSNCPIGRNQTFSPIFTKFGKCVLANLIANPSELGMRSMRCWVWCNSPDVSAAHVTFDNDNHVSANPSLAALVNLRSITNDVQLFNGVPPNLGFLHDERYGDMPVILGALRYGLNLVEYYLPKNTSVLQTGNAYHGYFKFSDGIAAPVVDTGNRKNLLRDTGPIYYQSSNTTGVGVLVVRCPEPENLSNAWSWVPGVSTALLINCELSVGYGVGIMGGLRGVNTSTPAPVDKGIMLYRSTATEMRIYPYILNNDGTTSFGTALATFTADSTVKEFRFDLTYDGSGNNVMTIYNGWNRAATLAAITFTKGTSMRAPIGGRVGTVYISFPTNTTGVGFAKLTQATVVHY